MKKIYIKFYSSNLHYKIIRYSCGHYALEVFCFGKCTRYPRLIRCQIEAVTFVSVKDAFNLHH